MYYKINIILQLIQLPSATGEETWSWFPFSSSLPLFSSNFISVSVKENWFSSYCKLYKLNYKMRVWLFTTTFCHCSWINASFINVVCCSKAFEMNPSVETNSTLNALATQPGITWNTTIPSYQQWIRKQMKACSLSNTLYINVYETQNFQILIINAVQIL